MVRADTLRRAIGEAVVSLQIPAQLKSRLSAGCHSAAMQNHAGIAVLFSLGLHAPAFALLRPAFESYVRGIWLSDCAKQAEISAFVAGVWQNVPSMGNMVDQLESTASIGTGILKQSFLSNWETLCGFTHSGIEQIQMHISTGAVESNCSPEQIDEALNFAGACAAMAGIAMATLADDLEAAKRIRNIAREFAEG